MVKPSIKRGGVLRSRSWATATLLLMLLFAPVARAQAVVSDAVASKDVLVLVNGSPITRQEVELAFKRSAPRNLSSEQAAMRKRAILADLVRAEAMAQDAIAKGLRDEAQLALESRMAHRQLLATKAEEAAGEATPAFREDEAKNLVTANPLLFAQRRQYTLEEVQLTTSDPTLFKRLDEAVKRTDADLDRAQRMAVEAGASTQRRVFATQSEALPEPLIKPLSNARVGQVLVLQYSVDRGALLGVKAAVAAPIVGEEAVQAAIAVGTDIRRRQMRLQRSQDVVNKARITYTPAAEAMSAPAVAAAASAPPAPEAALSAASAPEGPMVVSQERLADLPRGLAESPRKVMARKAAIGVGALLIGLAWLLMLVAVVRNSFERVWLPRLWPLKPPVETPSLLRIVAEAVVQPSTASVSWGTIGLRLMSLLGVLACVALPVMAFSAGLKHLPMKPIAAALVAGWLLGILLTHLHARRTWHIQRPSLGAGPVFGYQVLVLLLCGLAVRFL